nr:LPXTG cell wall anchor domain-containing protein [Furfurilactobacillus milii]
MVTHSPNHDSKSTRLPETNENDSVNTGLIGTMLLGLITLFGFGRRKRH